MKIKKDTLVESVNLREADEEKLPEIDPSDSAKEIKNDVKQNIETASGGDISGSAAENGAKEVADAVKSGANDISTKKVAVIPTEDAPLGVENKLTKILDDALRAALLFKRENIKEVANVLVIGLPGSGKTASVYDWAKGKVNLTYVNAKNNDLQAFIDGYTVQDPNNKLTVTQAVSKNLDSLDRPRSVLFLDEYNRQTKDQVRASLLTLINEHYVTGNEKGGRHYFPNFLFTIACINPACSQDEGAAKMNDAEKSRFLYTVADLDSDSETTVSYLKKQYGRLAKRLANMKDIEAEDVWADKMNELPEVEDMPDPDKLDGLKRIETLLRIQDLGVFLVDDIDFEYDNKDKLPELYRRDKKMLNQRAITSGLAASCGDVETFKNWVEHASNFLDSDIEMILKILAKYKAPTREKLFKDAGIDPNISPKDAAKVADEVAAENDDGVLDNDDYLVDDNSEEEDDTEIFDHGNNVNAASSIASESEVWDAINDTLKGF